MTSEPTIATPHKIFFDYGLLTATRAKLFYPSAIALQKTNSVANRAKNLLPIYWKNEKTRVLLPLAISY
jgi:hypothetical protein